MAKYTPTELKLLARRVQNCAEYLLDVYKTACDQNDGEMSEGIQALAKGASFLHEYAQKSEATHDKKRASEPNKT